MTASLTIAFLTGAVLIAMSFAAGRRIAPGQKRLPMQWNLKGEPTWTLPRPLALGFTPALGIIALTGLAHSRSVDLSVLLTVACGVILAHALHIFLLARRS